MNNFLNKNKDLLSNIGVIISIISIIFACGIFYSNTQSLDMKIDKEINDRESNIMLINQNLIDRMDNLEKNVLSHFNEYKYDFAELKEELLFVKNKRPPIKTRYLIKEISNDNVCDSIVIIKNDTNNYEK